MKKIILMIISLLLIFTLCGCGGIDSMKENLTRAGYKVSDMDESRLASLNNDIVYNYKGKGTVVSGFYATDENNGSVLGVEFTDREDMTVMYKEIKSQLEEGQIIDLKGKIVVYGCEDGVKTALK